MKTVKTTEKSTKTLSAALATSVLATALMSVSPVASAASSERCADIVKGGKNTCASKSLGISCQGNAKEDNMVGAWIKVPAGTCGNIVSICAGTAEAPEGTKEKKLAKACKKIAEQTDPAVVGGRLVDKFGESI
ncbi:hypothetical protein NBRC116583_16170 [Arenicella sp. 4NH20-0111]|uniref:BufA1 family periplasmic bufferin-type metallophore n=1 Tax=Arenicella sp. 4NH20-0111 TaxID=3127648 RepID=UPI00310928CF